MNEEFKNLSLEVIDTKGENSRTSIKDSSLRELMQSLKQVGQQSPILVSKDGRGRFHIVAGNRRYLAAKKLGWKNILVRVISSEDEIINHIAENRQRQGLTSVEYGRAYLAALEAEPDLTIPELAIRVGIPETEVKSCLSEYKNSTPEEQRLLAPRVLSGARSKHKGKIRDRHARELRAISRKFKGFPVTLRTEILRETANNGWSIDFMKRVARHCGSGMTLSRAVEMADDYATIDPGQVLISKSLKDLIEIQEGTSVRQFLRGVCDEALNTYAKEHNVAK